MVPPPYRYRWVQLLKIWVLRFFINLLKLSLTTTLAGNIAFALLMTYLFMTTGSASAAGDAIAQRGMQVFNFMLYSVTDSGDFAGGIGELGALIMAFLTPYLTVISSMVAIAETLTGHSLFRRLRWRLKLRLIALFTLFGLLMLLSVGASSSPGTDVPHAVRLIALSLFAGWSALLLLLLHGISLRAEAAFQQYRDRT